VNFCQYFGLLPPHNDIIILSYRCSYIQLDLGQLKVRNDFSWHGGDESDPAAVRLDVLHAEVFIGMEF
jgi:hypothetical protein